MRQILSRTRIIFILALLVGYAHAQFLGYVSLQTTAQQNVFNGQAANGVSATFNNIGQSAHSLTYCDTGFIGTISMEATGPDGTFTNPVPIAATTYGTADSGCHVLPAGGYYPAVHARVSNYSAGSISAGYSGIAGPVSFNPAALSSSGPNSPVNCDQSKVIGMTASQTYQPVAPVTGQSVYVCGFTMSMTAAPTSASAITLESGTGTTCGTGTIVLHTILLATTAPTVIPISMGNTVFRSAPGSGVCVVTNANLPASDFAISFAQF